MRIKKVKFVTSCAKSDDATVYAPQICVAGRSNCGKSSLLNAVMGSKLCRTSSTPGRTRLINVLEAETDSENAAARKFYFVDLPGYGYHQAGKDSGRDFAELTESYFENNANNIAQTLCLMDIRRDPSELDKILINYLRDLNLPFTVVLTKSDKLSRAQCANAKLHIAAEIGLARDNLIVTSAMTYSGKAELLTRIEEVIAAQAE